MKDRLQFVVGKGGVGRTSVAAGLALAAGRQGRRALVVELNGLWDVGRRCGQVQSFDPVPIAPGVHWCSLTTQACMTDFAKRKLRLGVVGATVMGSRPMQSFVDAIPGVPDLLQLGKIENMLNSPAPEDLHFDLVVVDSPATGHGLTLLSAPESMTEVSGTGLFHELASTIADALRDRQTGVVVTTLPEELPLSETEGLLESLESGPVRTSRLVVNRVRASPLPDTDQWPLVEAALLQSKETAVAELVPLATSLLEVYRSQQSVMKIYADLASRYGVGLSQVPMLPTVDTRVDLQAVGDALEAP